MFTIDIDVVVVNIPCLFKLKEKNGLMEMYKKIPDSLENHLSE